MEVRCFLSDFCVCNEAFKLYKTNIMAKQVLHKATTRGHANHGWLESFHSFSFAGYYNADRIHFGALRVLNDDVVAGGRGFGMHPHDNMEIVSIPLEGDLEHKDNMGNTVIIREGDVQLMSTGQGVFHSEFNYNADKPVKFLQIWLFPNKMNVTPRYDQVTLDVAKQNNQLQQVLSPDPNGEGVWLYQDAWFSMGRFDEDVATHYTIQKAGNGVYIFVLSGSFIVDGQELDARDGIGVWETDAVDIKAISVDARLLVMDVPMEVKLS